MISNLIFRTLSSKWPLQPTTRQPPFSNAANSRRKLFKLNRRILNVAILMFSTSIHTYSYLTVLLPSSIVFI